MSVLIITSSFIEKIKPIAIRVFKANETKLINKRAEERGDEYGEGIFKRLFPVSGLVASDYQYHSLSMRKMYNRPITQEKRKISPFANDAEAAMEEVYTYLENNDGE